ncbi:MAG: hypothetical protein WC708_14690 [Lentisphaeria bacterium]
MTLSHQAWRAVLAAALAAVAAAGCTSIQVGDRELVRKATAPGLNTKAAVLQRLGSPGAMITLDDGRQQLVYGNSAVRGGGLVLSELGVTLFSINRANRRGDVVEFTCTPAGRVCGVRVAAQADKAEWSIWPFSP